MYRTSRGWDRAELARRVDISVQRLKRIEDGDGRIEASLLFYLACALNLKVADFFDGEAGEDAIPVDPEARELMCFFAAIKSSGIRRSILKLAKALSEKP
jgi:transcriptional regulator with XRE-family HTH domain